MKQAPIQPSIAMKTERKDKVKYIKDQRTKVINKKIKNSGTF